MITEEQRRALFALREALRLGENNPIMTPTFINWTRALLALEHELEKYRRWLDLSSDEALARVTGKLKDVQDQLARATVTGSAGGGVWRLGGTAARPNPQFVDTTSNVYLIDAGGGRVVYSGSLEGLRQEPRSLTAKYLRDELAIPVPSVRRRPTSQRIRVVGAAEHNLKDLDVAIPLTLLDTWAPLPRASADVVSPAKTTRRGSSI